MYFASCLVSAFLLSTGVSAFYPLLPQNWPSGAPTTNSERRSTQLTPKDASAAVRKAPTLDLKRAQRNVRRDNNHKVVMGATPQGKNSMAISEDPGDISYFSVINVGSEGKQLWMLLDTGAENTWLMSSSCTTKACSQHNTIGKDDSSTLNVTNTPWEVTYGTGKATGFVANDTMSFAGLDLKVAFGYATWTSTELENYVIDGILGLGKTNRSAYSVTPTVMDIMAANNMLEKNILGINLQRAKDQTTDGQIVFGDVDSTKFTGDISYTNVVDGVNQWTIPVDDVVVDGKPANFKGKTAIVDTGSSFILMSDKDAATANSLIPGWQKTDSPSNYKIPCSSTAKFEFVFSGVGYSVSPKDYLGGADSTGSMCSSQIVGGTPYGDNGWLLGDVFLKNVYTVFDYDQSRVGFAKRKYSEPSSTSSVTDQPTSTSASSVIPFVPVPSQTTDGATARATGSSTPDSSKGAAPGLGISTWLSLLPLLAVSYVSGLALTI